MRNFLQNLKFSNSQILMRIYNAVKGYGLQVMGEVTLDNVSGMNREWIGNGSRNPLVLSRMTSTKAVLNQYLTPLVKVRFAANPILSRLCVASLILTIGTMNVWGATVTFNSTNSSFSEYSTQYNIHQDSIDFYLNNIPNWYNNGKGHFYVFTNNNNASISWTPKTGYTIAVTGVSLNGQNTKEYQDLWNRYGSSYIRSHTSSDNTEVKISQETSTNTYSYTTANNTNLFPGGTALGNNAYFKIRAEGYKKADGENSYEYQINYCTLTYTITPPAPTLINGSSLTRSQFVEGRSNNTVILTDYFGPFNSEVAMSYVVKKKNGNTFETINSGFDITSNVFKTTNVGVYQIFATSNATGAFTASASSNPIEITIEEVRPLTITVGSQELYVEGTTSMTITEQLNTTQSVVFEYNENFFAYNTSTHVLTAKNDGDVSFTEWKDTIRVTQASDGVYSAVDYKIPFVIKKRANTITNSLGGSANLWTKKIGLDDEIALTYTSSNTAVGAPSISISQSTGSSIALYNSGTNKITSNHNIGTATWFISQEEDYKYLASEATLTISVDTVSTNCLVLDTIAPTGETEWSITTVGTGPAFTLSGPGDKLTFDAYRTTAGGNYFFIQYKTATTNFADIPSDDGGNPLLQEGAFRTETVEHLPEGTTQIRFITKTGATLAKHYKNIKVTRKKYLTTKTTEGNNLDTLTIPTKLKLGTAKTASFYVNYSTCADFIKLKSSNSHFTFSNGTTSYEIEPDDEEGKELITLTYNSSVAEDVFDTLTIYTPNEHHVLIVRGITVDKLTPTITWPGETSFLVGSTIPNGFVAEDENGAAIDEDWTFASSDSTVIDIVDGELKAICGGTATISGIIGGDETNYFKDTLEIELTVTRNPDSFTWNGLEEDGYIHVYADSIIPNTVAEATSGSTITYTSGSSTYVTVTDGIVRAVAKGTTTLTATSAGNCNYNSGSETKTVVVEPNIQQIVWEQTFNHYKGDEEGDISVEVELTAYAVNAVGVRTEQPITYSFESDIDFAEIDDETNKLTISGLGRTRIIATAAGSTKYAEASVSKVLYARAHDAVCENDTLYVQGSDNKTGNDGGIYYKFKFTNNVKTEAREIVWSGGGYPGYVTLDYKTEDATQGAMKIEQYLPSVSDWRVVKNVGLAPQSKWTHDSLHLDSTATKLRVKIYEGNKSHYFRNVVVVRARFIEVREDSTAKNSLTYSTEVNTTQEKTLRVVHSNINTQIDLTLSDGAPFTLSDVDIDGTCDGSGYSDITLTYKPVATETNGSYTLTLTDGTVTKVITLTATATAGEKHVTADGNWSKIEWSGEPNSSTTVVVDANKKLTIDQEVMVYGLVIESGANVTVTSAGGLTVYAGGISGAGKDNITLKAGDGKNGTVKGKTGYLRVSPDYAGEMPSANVELYSIAFADNEKRVATWQYIGIPLGDTIGGWDICEYGKQFIYGWNEEAGDWYDGYAEKIAPFNGYCFTQNEEIAGKTFTFTGALQKPETINIPLSFAGAGGNKGYHVLANSFSAPIDITRFESIDFKNVDGTIYLFNTGSYSESYTVNNETNSTTPGQYIAVTPGTAPTIFSTDSTYPIMIPAMQGFCVQATKADASLKLDYQKLVWNANYGTHPNQPMRVAARNHEEQESNEPEVTDFIKVTLTNGETGDNLYLLASDSYDKDYENGYDAPKMMNEDVNIPNLFAVEDDRQLAIDATSDMESTFLGVRTGSATSYTLYFSHVNCETEWMLLDIKTNKTTLIVDGASYAFEADANSLITNRFLILESDGSAGTATGTDEMTIQNKIQKFIYNDQLYILKDGVLYNACGMMIRR